MVSIRALIYIFQSFLVLSFCLREGRTRTGLETDSDGAGNGLGRGWERLVNHCTVVCEEIYIFVGAHKKTSNFT